MFMACPVKLGPQINQHNCSNSNINDCGINIFINKFVYYRVDDYQLHVTHFDREQVSLRKNTMKRSNGLVCSRDKLDMLNC